MEAKCGKRAPGTRLIFAVGICCLGDGGDSVHFRQIWRIVKAEE